MYLLLRNIKWDTEGQDLDDCLLPEEVLLLAAPIDWDREDYLERVGDLLTDVFGFLHHGCDVVPYIPPQPGQPGTKVCLNAALSAPVSDTRERHGLSLYRQRNFKQLARTSVGVSLPRHPPQDGTAFLGLLLPPNNTGLAVDANYYCQLSEGHCQLTITGEVDQYGRVPFSGIILKPPGQ